MARVSTLSTLIPAQPWLLGCCPRDKERPHALALPGLPAGPPQARPLLPDMAVLTPQDTRSSWPPRLCFALTPLSGMPFLSFSTYSLLKPQIRCHLLCGVLSDCTLHSGQVSLPSFLGTHSPQAALSLQLGNLVAHVVIYPFPHSYKHMGDRNLG